MPAAMRKVFEQLFDFSQMSPLLEQRMLLDQMMMPMLLLRLQMQAERSYQQMSQAMAEEAERAIREERLSRTEPRAPDKKEKLESEQVTAFSILYYNPELRKVETVEEKVTIKTDSYSGPEQQAVEEAVGQKSMFGLYSLMGQPIMREKIDPYILESVLSKIEVENPKPFGGGTAVRIPNETFSRLEHRLQSEGKEEEIIALNAIKEVQAQKESLAKAIGKEILVLEEAIKSIQETEKKEEKIIEKLPPLSKIRYMALLKKKARLERTIISDLLISDVEFLEAMRKKLRRMGLREFLEIIKKIKKAIS